MTNTLHRRGAREELERDYILKCSLADSNREGRAEKIKAFVDIVRKHGPIAVRFPQTTLEWDAARMKFRNSREASRLVRRKYRAGWKVKGLS